MNHDVGALSPDDRALLEPLLANEMDMAFRRRVFALLEFLELPDEADVLDCGCGEGFYLVALRRLRPARASPGWTATPAAWPPRRAGTVRRTS